MGSNTIHRYFTDPLSRYFAYDGIADADDDGDADDADDAGGVEDEGAGKNGGEEDAGGAIDSFGGLLDGTGAEVDYGDTILEGSNSAESSQAGSESAQAAGTLDAEEGPAEKAASHANDDTPSFDSLLEGTGADAEYTDTILEGTDSTEPSGGESAKAESADPSGAPDPVDHSPSGVGETSEGPDKQSTDPDLTISESEALLLKIVKDAASFINGAFSLTEPPSNDDGEGMKVIYDYVESVVCSDCKSVQRKNEVNEAIKKATETGNYTFDSLRGNLAGDLLHLIDDVRRLLDEPNTSLPPQSSDQASTSNESSQRLGMTHSTPSAPRQLDTTTPSRSGPQESQNNLETVGRVSWDGDQNFQGRAVGDFEEERRYLEPILNDGSYNRLHIVYDNGFEDVCIVNSNSSSDPICSRRESLEPKQKSKPSVTATEVLQDFGYYTTALTAAERSQILYSLDYEKQAKQVAAVPTVSEVEARLDRERPPVKQNSVEHIMIQEADGSTDHCVRTWRSLTECERIPSGTYEPFSFSLTGNAVVTDTATFNDSALITIGTTSTSSARSHSRASLAFRDSSLASRSGVRHSGLWAASRNKPHGTATHTISKYSSSYETRDPSLPAKQNTTTENKREAAQKKLTALRQAGFFKFAPHSDARQNILDAVDARLTPTERATKPIREALRDANYYKAPPHSDEKKQIRREVEAKLSRPSPQPEKISMPPVSESKDQDKDKEKHDRKKKK